MIKLGGKEGRAGFLFFAMMMILSVRMGRGWDVPVPGLLIRSGGKRPKFAFVRIIFIILVSHGQAQVLTNTCH